MWKKITALSLSLILALTAALCFSSAPAMAAPSLTYASWGSLGLDLRFRYIQSDANIAPTVVNQYGNNYRMSFQYDTQSQFGLPVSSYAGKYITGFVLVVGATTFYPPSSITVNNESYGFTSYDQHGDGWTTSGITNTTERNFTAILYLDNYYVPAGSSDTLYFPCSIFANYSGIFTGNNNAGFTCTVDATSLPTNRLDLTDAPTGDLSGTIAGAINGSSSIQQILTLLNAISGNTALLQSVVNKMDNISGVLANLYSQLQQGNSYLNSLGWALAGINIQASDGATVSQAVYDRWVSIIKDAMEDMAPDTSEQESQLADREQQLADQEALESDAYAFSGDSIGAIDWNLDVPDQIAGAALVIMAMVSDIWEKLGILQFAVTAACTVGLVTIVLGVVNRFSSIKSRNSRSANKGNIDNNNKTN